MDYFYWNVYIEVNHLKHNQQALGPGCSLFFFVWFRKMNCSITIFSRAKYQPTNFRLSEVESLLKFSFNQIRHRHHFGRLCCKMPLVHILTDQMQSIVTNLGAVRSHFCRCFPMRFSLYLCLAAPGNWFGFWRQPSRFEPSCLFYYDEEPCQASVVFFGAQFGRWRMCIFWITFMALAVVRCFLPELGNFLS